MSVLIVFERTAWSTPVLESPLETEPRLSRELNGERTESNAIFCGQEDVIKVFGNHCIDLEEHLALELHTCNDDDRIYYNLSDRICMYTITTAN